MTGQCGPISVINHVSLAGLLLQGCLTFNREIKQSATVLFDENN